MTLDFKFWADATGIVPIKEEMKEQFEKGGKPSIRKHLNILQNTVYGYEKEIHGPPYLKLVWGEVFPNSTPNSGDSNPSIFKGTLHKCKVNIKLFSLSGEPVKAEINLSLKSQMAPETRPMGNSPDLTHVYEITHGEKMTSYCNEIYGRYDVKICSAVADYNNMIDWTLRGGMKIIFPSIHLLNEKYLNNLEEEPIKPMSEKTEEEIMRQLIGNKRADQYYKLYPAKKNKIFKA
jgi:hypothetical protein